MVIHSSMDILSQGTMVLDLCLLMELELKVKKTEKHLLDNFTFYQGKRKLTRFDFP